MFLATCVLWKGWRHKFYPPSYLASQNGLRAIHPQGANMPFPVSSGLGPCGSSRDRAPFCKRVITRIRRIHNSSSATAVTSRLEVTCAMSNSGPRITLPHVAKHWLYLIPSRPKPCTLIHKDSWPTIAVRDWDRVPSRAATQPAPNDFTWRHHIVGTSNKNAYGCRLSRVDGQPWGGFWRN